MVLMGFLAFLDPPKASAAGAVATLEAKGVAVKVLTGDNDRVAATVCEQIGIDASNVLLGSEIDALDDAELTERAEKTHLFAKLSPLQKARLVRVMRELLGHTVGFMGDGINDAAAMRASDCGISVDSAVDIAKESADIILLQKGLDVLERGIIEGRRTYGNLLKYLKITVSSNFGNVLSVTVASLFLPFLPMSALQLVLLSLVYEIVCIALPWDTVDAAWTARPRAWEAASIKGFMLELGPVSSLFDIVTFAALFFVVCPAAMGASWAELAAAGDVAGMSAFAALFQSGWFVESMWSQTLVIHMLRSPRLPSPRDHAAPRAVRAHRAGLGARHLAAGKSHRRCTGTHAAAGELLRAAHRHRRRLHRTHSADQAPLHRPPRRAAVVPPAPSPRILGPPRPAPAGYDGPK